MKYAVSYKELLLNDGYILKEDLFDTKVKQGYYKIDKNDPVYLTFTGKIVLPTVYYTIYKIFQAQSKAEKDKAVEIGVLSKLGLYFLLSGLLIQNSLSAAGKFITTKQKIDELRSKREKKENRGDADNIIENARDISREYLDETTKTDPLESLLSETYKMIFEDDGTEEEKKREEESIATQIKRSFKLLVTVKRISFDISKKVADLYFGSTRIIYLVAVIGIMFFSYLLISLGTLMIKSDIWKMKELQSALKAICSKIYTKASMIQYNSKTDFFKGISKIFWGFLIAAVKNLPAAIASTLSGIWNAIKRIPEMIKSFFGSEQKKNEGFLVAGDTILLRETAVLKEAINLGIFDTIGNVLKKILKFIFSRYGLLAIGVLIVIKAFMSVPSNTAIDRMYKTLANQVAKDAEEGKGGVIDQFKKDLLNQIEHTRELIDKSTELDEATKKELKKVLDNLKNRVNEAKDIKDLEEVAEKLKAINKKVTEAKKETQDIAAEKERLLKQIEEVEHSITNNTSTDNITKQIYLDEIKEIRLEANRVKNMDDIKKLQSKLNELSMNFRNQVLYSNQ
jgi:hypothetical protein